MKIKTNQLQLYDKDICCVRVFAQQNDITLRELISLAIHQCFPLLTLKKRLEKHMKNKK